MVKRFLIFSGVLSFALGLSAEILSPHDALARLSGKGMAKLPPVGKLAPEPVFTAYTQQDEPSLYIFAKDEGNGFVMMSADDMAVPVLGYSDAQNFDIDNLPPQLQWWMSEYSREINYGRKLNTPAYIPLTQNEEWEKIEPMIKTKWNQDAPYNNDCPSIRSQKCYTGCVATAMAQVMNYFKYPDKGEGTSRYVCPGIGRLELNFADKKFDWSNMLDSYASGDYTDAQAAAVAYLMEACGYAVEMSYGTDASGASSIDISKGFTKYLKYDENIRYEMRFAYSESQWSSMIYDNLKNVGPVVYNGNSPNGGHSFVCDGYDGNGYFHFNWGWGGSADGYFILNALNPMTQGIGGSEGGFNSHQDVILGIQVPNGEPVVHKKSQILQYGALHGEFTDGKIQFTFTNWSPTGITNFTTENFRCYLGAIIEPVDGTVGNTVYEKCSNYDVVAINSGSYYSSANGFRPEIAVPSALADGRYKVTFASKVSTTQDSEWLPAVPPYGYPNYLYLNKVGSDITLENIGVPMLGVESFTPISDCYYGYPVKMNIVLHNDTEFELTQNILPLLMNNGKRAFVGESQLFTLMPGETKELVWDVRWQQQDGAEVPASGKSLEYTLMAYNPDADIYFGDYGNIEMTRLKSRNNFRSRGLEIVGSDMYDDAEFGAVYSVNDPSSIMLDQKIEVVSGFFAYPLMARVYTESASQSGYLQLEMEQRFNDIPFISSGNITNVSAIVEFPEASDNTLYYIRTFYVQNNLSNQLAQVRFVVKHSGIMTILDGNEEITLVFDRVSKTAYVSSESGISSVEAYNMNGSSINVSSSFDPCGASLDFQNLDNCIVILRVTDTNNNQKTFKIAL